MKISSVLNIKTSDDIAEVSIVGDIGYNYWADTHEEYKKNTSENIAKELNALKDLKVKSINLYLESLGGDVHHALAIYSQLRQSNAEIKTYLRGANASASTIIASASKKENIFMENTGLYLVHKPMTYAEGNINDMQDTIKSLEKHQKAIETAYLNIGVKQDVLNELMERNGGHGEWLTFEEAKEYGFVGNAWETKRVSNYTKNQFINRNILIPKNIINNKKIKKMEMIQEDKKNLFADFKNWFKNEEEQEEKMNELEALKVENEDLKKQIDDLKTEIEALKVENENLKENEEATKVENEKIIEDKVKEKIKDLANQSKDSKQKEVLNSESPAWKKLYNIHNKIK